MTTTEPPVSVTTVDGGVVARDHDLEALWFALSHLGDMQVTLVPVPDVRAVEVLAIGGRLARVGAMISGTATSLIDASHIEPADVARTCAVVDLSCESQSILVVESPVLESASIPFIKSGIQVVVVVGLGRSRADLLADTCRLVPPEHLSGVVCLTRGRRGMRERVSRLHR